VNALEDGEYNRLSDSFHTFQAWISRCKHHKWLCTMTPNTARRGRRRKQQIR